MRSRAGIASTSPDQVPPAAARQSGVFWPARIADAVRRRWRAGGRGVPEGSVSRPWPTYSASVLLPAAGLLLAGLWSWVEVTSRLDAEIVRDMALLRAQTLRTLHEQVAMMDAVESATAALSWTEIRASRPVHQLLIRLASAADERSVIGLIDPDGRIAEASDLRFPAAPIDLSDRDYVTAVPRGAPADATFVGAAVLSRVDGRPEVHLSRPHVAAGALAGSRSGPPAGDGGVVVAGFRPALFETLFAEVAGSRRATILLLRGDGSLLARFPDPVAPGNLRPLRATDPVRVAARALPPADGLLLDRATLRAEQRIGSFDLLLALQLDAAEARTAWLAQMLFPALGASATAATLLLLARHSQLRLAAEAARLRQQTEQAEAERAAAQERARLEAQLRQTEKQAALGLLASGVAHDFNNLLQAVLAGVSRLQRQPLNPDRLASSVQVISRAAERGVALTRRMLDFARAEESEGRPAAIECFAPEAALRGAYDLLSPLLGASWPVTLVLPQGRLPAALGNLSECETVLLNLAINARDAMPAGGGIVLEAALAEPPARLSQLPLGQAAYGACVRLSVRDTGCGMDQETLTRAGEAFFTTKPRGAGTGLGLSMARGFAQRSGGALELTSQAGVGTTVTLWLAAC